MMTLFARPTAPVSPSISSNSSSGFRSKMTDLGGGVSPFKKRTQKTRSQTYPKRSLFLRTTTALFLILAGGMAVVLFTVKYQVRDLEAKQDRLVRELGDERRSLHVLRAEWANLNDPKRIRALAEQYLHMRPILPSQVMGMAGVLDIPVREATSFVQEDVIHEKP